MSLALRLLIYFGLLALLATVTVGIGAREAWRRAEEQRFDEQLHAAKLGVLRELSWEASQIRDLLQSKCEHDTDIDRTLVDLERGRGELDAGRRLAVSQLVPEEMKALHLDELLLFTAKGEILGAGHDPAGAGRIDPTLGKYIGTKGPNLAFRPATSTGRAALVTMCSRQFGTQAVGLLGARHVDSMLGRIGEVYGVRLSTAPAAPTPATSDEATLVFEAPGPELAGLRVRSAISRKPLEQNLAWVDTLIVLASALTVAIAMLPAIWLARRLARPLEALAAQAGEIARGDPRPVSASGGGREVEAFARSFNKALDDLVKLRKRLATTERIAARREIARQVAHEIKNPLAPIRAAVETLRRLRARQDPAFDGYFDEATRTVLDEVHRITKIVSEFTEFARLPAPQPGPVKLDEVARSTVALYAAGGAEVTLETSPCPTIQADKDQLAQVLTNLIQNGLDAGQTGGHTPKVSLRIDPAGPDRVSISVADNGPGVSADMLPRLFEPYATNKPNGTGLGLAIVQRIVQEHGGEISYETGGPMVNSSGSAPGGAIFRVVLPVGGPTLLPGPTEPPDLPRAEPRG
jgi:two-component system nitrogen regulation sensor histidine kinase NtrY